jgi:putative transcriptional regulator
MSQMSFKKGDILLSQPFMMDGYFSRTAILLAELNEEGAIGFVINRPVEILVDEIIPDFPDFNAIAYMGGPVSTDTLHYVHRVGELLDESIEIISGIYWGGNFEQLKALIRQGIITPDDIRFYIGYSGWSEGQLEGEWEMGSWLRADFDMNFMFNSEPEALWKKILSAKGENFTIIADMPSEDLLN